MSEYKISNNCVNLKAFDICLKCGKCGRKFHRGILVDKTGSEWKKYINDAIRNEERRNNE